MHNLKNKKSKIVFISKIAVKLFFSLSDKITDIMFVQVIYDYS